MSGHDDHGLDPDLLALYRSAAVERPGAELDQTVLTGAARELLRTRARPWVALAATLLFAALLAPAIRGRLATSYDRHTADAYLLQVQAPVAPEDVSGPADAYLLELPAISADL